MAAELDRRRGRPPLIPGERTLNINTAFPESQYDALCLLAERKGKLPLPVLVRLAVMRLLNDERGAVIRM